MGKGKVLIGVTVPKDLVSIIDERRGPLDWPRAKYTLAVLQWWKKQGCPPISSVDETGQLMAAEGKAPYQTKKAASY